MASKSRFNVGEPIKKVDEIVSSMSKYKLGEKG